MENIGKGHKRDRNRSSASDDDLNTSKYVRFTKSPLGVSDTIEISGIIGETNSVLYEDDIQVNASTHNSFTALLQLSEEDENSTTHRDLNMADINDTVETGTGSGNGKDKPGKPDPKPRHTYQYTESR